MNLDGSMIRRDEMPFDFNNPLSYPTEGSHSSADHRLGTTVMLILLSELDTSDPAVHGNDRPWTEQATIEAAVNAVLDISDRWLGMLQTS